MSSNLSFQKVDILYDVLQSVDIPTDLSVTEEALPVNPRTQEPTFPGVSFDLEQFDFGNFPTPTDTEIEDLMRSEGMEGLIGPDPLWPGPLDPRDMVETAYSSSSSSSSSSPSASTDANQQRSTQVRARPTST
jgi:hypothetical protein